MSLKWVEGFEIHQTTGYLARKYAAVAGTLTSTTGRLFGSCIRMTGSSHLTTPSFGVENVWIVGFGFKLSAFTGTPTVTLLSGASEQLHLTVVSSGGGYVWRLLRGATTIATSAEVLTFDVWYYIELKVTVRDGVDGAYELRIDEETDISGSGVNLANTGTDGADVVMISASTTAAEWDDIYICDDQGADNNDFLGDSAIRGLLPTAEGTTNDWVPSTGTNNAALVDDPASAPNDSDYVRGVNNGDLDLYAYDNLAGLVNGPIRGVMVCSDMRMETTGTATVKVVVRQGGVNFDGATHTVNGTVVTGHNQVLENSPDDSAPWEVADIDNAEFGVEKVS